jgi:hypothetical protein
MFPLFIENNKSIEFNKIKPDNWIIKRIYLKKNLFVIYQILLFIRFIVSSYTSFPFCLSPLKHSLHIFSIISSGGIFSWFIVISVSLQQKANLLNLMVALIIDLLF